jgi:MoaA/NifB/PqqE/SkfB family radical SAM enzyme
MYGVDTEIRRGASAALFRNNIETLMAKKTGVKSNRPLIGLQIVATKTNYQFITGSIEYCTSIGIERFIVSNLYPYSAAMANEVLYDNNSKKNQLHKLLRHEIKLNRLTVANQNMRVNRRCPFIEKGTLFITAEGDITTCPELAYSHPAFYSGTQRLHNRFILGNISSNTLVEIWNNREFVNFRNKFLYYEFPDCSYCQHPDLCAVRTEKGYDCYDNPTPCGECLWARNIIICP